MCFKKTPHLHGVNMFYLLCIAAPPTLVMREMCASCGIFKIIAPEAVTRRCSIEKVFLEISQNSQENSCAKVSFLVKLQAETSQVFSCEFCKISKNTFC